MSYRPFLYFLLDKDGKSYVLQGKAVTTLAQASQLKHSPSGWQEILIGYQRDMDKLGLITSFTFPLDFVLDGATILRNIGYTKSIEEIVYLYIAQFRLTLDNNFFYPKYKYFYRAPLDFTTFQDDGTKVTVKLRDNSLNALIKANGGTTYEFPLDDPKAISIKMTGLPLTQKQNFLIPKSGTSFTEYLGVQTLTKEGAAAGFAAFSVFRKNLKNYDELKTSLDYFCTVTQDITGIKLTGKVKTNPTVGVAYSLLVYNQDRQVIATLIPQHVPTGSENYNIDLSFDGKANDKYFLITSSDWAVEYEETELSLSFASTYRQTYVKAFLPTVMHAKLAGQATGSEDNAASQLLTDHNNLAITCGDAIRGLAKAKIKTTYNDFFSTWRAILGAGMGVESGKVLIENRKHFLDDSDPIDLGPVSNLRISYAADLLGNTIKVGYQKQNIDDVNGKYSSHNTFLFKAPVNSMQEPKELSFISPYLADPYYIETIRINLDEKTTTDDSSDNEVFLLNVRATGSTFTGTFAISTTTFLGATLTLVSISGAPDRVDLFKAGVVFTIQDSQYNNKTFTVTVDAGLDPATNIITFLVAETANQNESTNNVTISTQTYELNRPAFDSVSGIPGEAVPGIFNLELLTPKRMLLQQLSYLNGIYNNMAGKVLAYSSTDKNADLKTVQGTSTIEEKADVPLTNSKLFLPWYCEFDTETPIDLAETMEQYPNKAFRIWWNGDPYLIFNIKSGLAPNDLKPQTFKGWFSPNNDLSKLI